MAEDSKIHIDTADALRVWLVKNHASDSSVWLVKWKKSSGKPYISYDDIVDLLLCYGWVDSLPNKLDSERTMLRISPRNPKSNWSKVNKQRVKRLTAERRMHKAGTRLVELAKASGTWTFLDDVEALVLPADLQDALVMHPKAEYYFNRFPDSSKRGILEWIKTAKQASTRAKRIKTTSEKAAQNLKANFPTGRDAGPKEGV